MHSEQQLKDKKNPYYFIYDNLSVNEPSSSLPGGLLPDFPLTSSSASATASGSAGTGMGLGMGMGIGMGTGMGIGGMGGMGMTSSSSSSSSSSGTSMMATTIPTPISATSYGMVIDTSGIGGGGSGGGSGGVGGGSGGEGGSRGGSGGGDMPSMTHTNYGTLVAQLSGGPSTTTPTNAPFANPPTNSNCNFINSYASTASNARNYNCRENVCAVDKDKDKDNEWTVLKNRLNASPSECSGGSHTYNSNYNHNLNYNYNYNYNYNHTHHPSKFVHTAVQTDIGGLRNKLLLIPCTDYKTEQDVFNLANANNVPVSTLPPFAMTTNAKVTNSCDSSRYNVNDNTSLLLPSLPGTFARERKKQKAKKQKKKIDNNLVFRMETGHIASNTMLNDAIRNTLGENKQTGKRPMIKMGTDSMYRFDIENRTYTHPFKCLLCATSGLESRFTRKSSLRRHVETKHPSCDKNASWIIVQRRPRISKHFREHWNNKYLLAKKHDEMKSTTSPQQQQLHQQQLHQQQLHQQQNTKSAMAKGDEHSLTPNTNATSGNLPWNQVFPELYLFQNPDMFNQLVSSNETAEAIKRMEAAKNCDATMAMLRTEPRTSEHCDQSRNTERK